LPCPEPDTPHLIVLTTKRKQFVRNHVPSDMMGRQRATRLPTSHPVLPMIIVVQGGVLHRRSREPCCGVCSNRGGPQPREHAPRACVEGLSWLRSPPYARHAGGDECSEPVTSWNSSRTPPQPLFARLASWGRCEL
jgi:hypothetical protein